MSHKKDCDYLLLSIACDCDNAIPLSRPVTHCDKLLIAISTSYEKSLKKALLAVIKVHKPIIGLTGGYDWEDNPIYKELCGEC